MPQPRNPHNLRRRSPAESRGLAGTWRDENGSILEIQEYGTALGGCYHADFTHTGALEPFDLTGFACGDFLSFTVDFSPHGSLAAFAGQAFPNARSIERLHLVWLLTETPEDAADPGAILSGSTDFLRADD